MAGGSMKVRQEFINKWNDDSEAWSHLNANFIDNRGLISPKEGHIPSEEDMGAIIYLCYEWDYGYEGHSNAG
jgi:hypothetical protein